MSTTSTNGAGTAAVFCSAKPLAGWRQATARARRTKADWALEVADLLEGRYADCPKIALVSDNLNTHTKGRDAARRSVAWSTDVNGTQRGGVDWQMKVDDARW